MGKLRWKKGNASESNISKCSLADKRKRYKYFSIEKWYLHVYNQRNSRELCSPNARETLHSANKTLKVPLATSIRSRIEMDDEAFYEQINYGRNFFLIEGGKGGGGGGGGGGGIDHVPRKITALSQFTNITLAFHASRKIKENTLENHGSRRLWESRFTRKKNSLFTFHGK